MRPGSGATREIFLCLLCVGSEIFILDGLMLGLDETRGLEKAGGPKTQNWIRASSLGLGLLEVGWRKRPPGSRDKGSD
jgi:hypothetical protein